MTVAHHLNIRLNLEQALFRRGESVLPLHEITCKRLSVASGEPFARTKFVTNDFECLVIVRRVTSCVRSLWIGRQFGKVRFGFHL